MPESPFAAIILAAGASTRLGRPKQLIRMAGETLLHRTVRIATEAGCAPVFAVLGYEANEMRAELDGLTAAVLVNETWREGMGSSLRCGMVAVSKLGPPAGLLVLVCDQPALSCEHVKALLAAHAAADALVTASLYSGRAGVPAIFSPRLFPELLCLEGDRGARDLIRSCGGKVQLIPWSEGALDLDGPEDLRRAGMQ